MLTLEKNKDSTKGTNERVSWQVNNIKAIIMDDMSNLLKDLSDVSSHYALKKILSTPGE